MIKQPAYLKKGDKIAIVCPAKKLPRKIDDAIAILEDWGLEVILGESVYADYHQFAGDDQLRTRDLQKFLDDPEIKAVVAGRGGYGTIRIIDELDFSGFRVSPKWMLGFSDITVLLSHIFAVEQTQCIHAQMPYTFDTATPESLESLRKVLFGEHLDYNFPGSSYNKPGQAEGILIGGNLTLLVMLNGSSSEMDFKDKILFLEDVGESEYAIDRMMRMLKRSGKLAELKGLIVGAFNEIKPENIPFGWSAEGVIAEIVKEYSYPVAYNCPVGHIDDNMAMCLGMRVQMNVSKKNTTIC